ncbi:MAG: D-alanyl-D-alanine carboxypeptidase family protein [Hyphomonadaceae bacterium]
MLICLALVSASTAQAQEKYASFVVETGSGEVLHARFADAQRYPASLTKVMTLYMLFDAMKAGSIALDDELYVSAEADAMPASDLGIDEGGFISVEDAIYALVTKSANDIAVVVAERIAGNEARFAALMTVKARFLGLENTRFYNASGLPDERQVTTARDMALLAEAMLDNHGDYYHYFENRMFRWDGVTYRNHNKLLGAVDGVDGIKTGYTRASGFNLMASARRGNQRVVAIMMGGRSSRSRNNHVKQLIEAAFVALEDRADDPQTPEVGVNTQIAFNTAPRTRRGIIPYEFDEIDAVAETGTFAEGSAYQASVRD